MVQLICTGEAEDRSTLHECAVLGHLRQAIRTRLEASGHRPHELGGRRSVGLHLDGNKRVSSERRMRRRTSFMRPTTFVAAAVSSSEYPGASKTTKIFFTHACCAAYRFLSSADSVLSCSFI
jgi:hypothetical protein